MVVTRRALNLSLLLMLAGLLWVVRDISAENRRLKDSAGAPLLVATDSSWIPTAGHVLTRVSLHRSSDIIVWPTPGARLSLVLIRRPSCRHCDAVATEWDRLAEPARRRGVLTLTINLAGRGLTPTSDGVDGAPELLAEFAILNPQLVPLILLARGDRVLGSWPAVLDEQQQAAIHAALVRALASSK